MEKMDKNQQLITDFAQGQNKRARGDVPSLEDDQKTPEQVRHEELIALISGNRKEIQSVGAAVATLSQKVDGLDLKVNALEKRVDFVSGQYENQKAATDTMIKASSAIDARVIALEQKNEALSKKLDVEVAKRELLEANGRKINMEISGIPEEEDEDPKALVAKVMTLVGSVTPPEAIDVAHRKMNGEMIVKFRTRHERDEVYDCRFALAGKTSLNLGFRNKRYLYFNENLSIEKGQLMHDVRAYMKSINEGKSKETYYKIKTENGKIKVMNTFRKYIVIHGMDVLAGIHPK